MRHGLPWIKRGVAATLLSVGVLALTATAAFAHECKNESRTAIGDARAAAGNGWTLTSDIAFLFGISELTELDPLTPEQLAEAQAIVAEQKASGDYDAIYAEDRALLDHATAMNGNSRDGYTSKSSDDRGIDHLFADFAEIDPLFNHLVGIYISVQG